MDRLNFITSFSGGKDSTLALYRMIQRGHICKGLIITVNKYEEKSFFHGISNKLIDEISNSLNIPVYKILIGENDYEEKFIETLKTLRENNINTCVFGDIDIDNHRKWCENVCDKSGFSAEFPLWNENRKDVVYEFIDAGFKAIIKTVNKKYLPKEFVGKTLSIETIEEMKNYNVDVCGENGEYHTIVIGGPIFKEEVQLKYHEIKENENYATLNLI